MSTQLIDDVCLTDIDSNTAVLLDAQSQYPLIEISKSLDGIQVGGLMHSFPVFLSDIYVTLSDTQDKLLSKEQELNNLQ